MFKSKLVRSVLRPRDGNFTKSCQGGITFARSQTLATSRGKSFVLPRGMYVLPFELPLSQDMPETVTGVGHKYHAYEVQSIIFHRNSHLDTMCAHPIRPYRLPRILQGYLLDQVIAITPKASDSITYNSILSAIAQKEHAIVCQTHENLRYTNAQSPDLLDS
ncbi:hypothetical protein BP00DRAFT_414652 [Aspergillus indologenus CBS 114.80]|uniref:Uncharacterized protein n=1 Tax=Aspergillus indologenus CBS 114.80 TaxID=1450541 RepID=A0A2V5IEG1_9EURO|nr:hypothetical protein BP00DRAFT_414652 [Aspergillus indologenus CBS 114.80]